MFLVCLALEANRRNAGRRQAGRSRGPMGTTRPALALLSWMKKKRDGGNFQQG